VAGPIVDQENPVRLAGFCFLNDNFNCGQSFRQDHDNISGAGFYVDPGYGDGSSGTVTLSIFSNYGGGAPSGLIASGTAANIDRNSGWVDVFFTRLRLSQAINTTWSSRRPILLSLPTATLPTPMALRFTSARRRLTQTST
jgi:hypothetical protein